MNCVNRLCAEGGTKLPAGAAGMLFQKFFEQNIGAFRLAGYPPRRKAACSLPVCRQGFTHAARLPGGVIGNTPEFESGILSSLPVSRQGV